MKQVKTIENLREIKEILDNTGIAYWIENGTLLGAVRSGKSISWDNDIDFGTWYNNSEKIIRSLPPNFLKKCSLLISNDRHIKIRKPGLNGLKIDISLYRKKQKYALKTWIIDKTLIQKILRKIRYLLSLKIYKKHSIWVKSNYNKKHFGIKKLIPICIIFSSIIPKKIKTFFGDVILSILKSQHSVYLVGIPIHHYQRLSKIQFYGIMFKAPSDKKKYLEYKYGKNWRIPKKDWIYYIDDGAVLKRF